MAKDKDDTTTDAPAAVANKFAKTDAVIDALEAKASAAVSAIPKPLVMKGDNKPETPAGISAQQVEKAVRSVITALDVETLVEALVADLSA